MENVKELWWSKANLAPMYKTNDGEIHNGTFPLMDGVYNYIWEMTDGMDTADIPDKVWLGHVSDYLENYCIWSDIKYLGIKNK
jgi:hypothetical protein